jgi:PAS domain S-box-containing protein
MSEALAPQEDGRAGAELIIDALRGSAAEAGGSWLSAETRGKTQLWQILDALPAAVYATDPAGKIVYYNRAAAELAGREPEIGKDEWCVSFRLFSADGEPLPHSECPMAIALRENRPVRGAEVQVQRPDGTLVPVLPFPTPIHDANGEILGAVNMLVDVSERKQAETHQRVLLNELNHRVKNNIQMLYGLLRTAQRETGSAEAKEVLADASQRVAAMAAAQQLLYSDKSPRSFSIGDFLQAVCDSAKQAFHKDIAIRIDADRGELANETCLPLALILNELLTNAAKYGVNGRRTGEIAVALKRADGDYVLSVADDGPGFDRRETGRRSSGLGLVSGLARQLRGTFAVEPGVGARCVVRFPAASPA